jgi:uncharacterized damage-inducible protein DinB
MPDLRYPIGQFQMKCEITPEERRNFLLQSAEIPDRLKAAVDGLSQSRLDTPYRAGGWTVRQVVHHLSDSHLNWYARTKLALTEVEPVIKPYDQNLWADLQDARVAPIEASLHLLGGLHQRWVRMFESLEAADWARKMLHPEMGSLTIETVLLMSVWHGRHHTAHIAELRKRMNW